MVEPHTPCARPVPTTFAAPTERVRRAIHRVIDSLPQHWIGDGFPARAYLTPHDELARRLSPFLLLDYGGRYDFAPTERRRGVGGHPNRGFETVTDPEMCSG
jgi:redox-sensitive bicupin YhaK (pirin superfamily)